MKLIITIDVEEDDWGYNTSDHSLKNIEQISCLQSLFDEFKVKPTYLITYPVATDESAAGLIKKILDDGRCEIGAHCHPWNTPPFENDNTEFNSMLFNLPNDLQYQKIKNLRDSIAISIGQAPRSFRAGRWGFDHKVAWHLCKLGFKVDSSISPICDWTIYHGPNFIDACQSPYFVDCYHENDVEPELRLIELPVTIGFLRKNQTMQKFMWRTLKLSYLKHFHLLGVFKRLKLLNLVWLSPEVNTGKEMIQLTRTFKRLGHDYINMSFHSTSLLPGKSPFVINQFALDLFYGQIRTFLTFAKSEEIISLTLSEAADDLAKKKLPYLTSCR